MRSMKPLLFAGLAALCTSMSATAATVPELVTKVRAALGTESGLNAVKSLRYTYRMADKDGKETGLYVSEYLAPMCHRDIDYTMKDRDGRALEIIVSINGAEGYRRINAMGTDLHNLSILTAGDVDLLRDYASDNLTFFAPPSPARGTVVTAPDETVEGVDCHVLAYKYRTGLTLRYYFAKSDNRVVASRAERPNGVREGLQVHVGEQRVAGIVFPKAVRILDTEGKPLKTMTVEKVEVNPADITAKTFATPLY